MYNYPPSRNRNLTLKSERCHVPLDPSKRNLHSVVSPERYNCPRCPKRHRQLHKNPQTVLTKHRYYSAQKMESLPENLPEKWYHYPFSQHKSSNRRYMLASENSCRKHCSPLGHGTQALSMEVCQSKAEYSRPDSLGSSSNIQLGHSYACSSPVHKDDTAILPPNNKIPSPVKRYLASGERYPTSSPVTQRRIVPSRKKRYLPSLSDRCLKTSRLDKHSELLRNRHQPSSNSYLSRSESRYQMMPAAHPSPQTKNTSQSATISSQCLPVLLKNCFSSSSTHRYLVSGIQWNIYLITCLLLLLASCSAQEGTIELKGAGASFPNQVYQKWIRIFQVDMFAVCLFCTRTHRHLTTYCGVINWYFHILV